MSVPVTKRVAKMKDGDLYPKPEKKTGWWVQIAGMQNFWPDYNMREKVFNATGHRLQYIQLRYNTVGKVVSSYPANYAGSRIGMRDHFVVFPTYASVSKDIKDVVDEGSYYCTIGIVRTGLARNHVFVGDKIVIPVKRPYITKFNLGDKYVRTATWPTWLFDVMMEMEPLS